MEKILQTLDEGSFLCGTEDLMEELRVRMEKLTTRKRG